MASLYFYYGAMGSSKSASLLMAAHTYQVQGKRVLLLTNSIDDRTKSSTISSRVGIDSIATSFNFNDDLFDLICRLIDEEEQRVSCIFIDEAQFLTSMQVFQLTEVVDVLNIPVLCYGLKTDFRGDLFEGSKALLEWAESFKEIKTTCFLCERKAIMNLRTVDGIPTVDGSQIQIGDEEYYPLCRKHYKQLIASQEQVNENN